MKGVVRNSACFFGMALESKPRAFHMPGKHSTSGLHTDLQGILQYHAFGVRSWGAVETTPNNPIGI